MPVITLSRQTGCGCDEIAQLLCNRLGYRYFDKDLMLQLAAQQGLASDQVVDLPEDKHHVRSLVERFFGTAPTHFGEIRGWAFAAREEVHERMEEMSVQTTQSLIRAAHEQDKVVMVGRGGQVVLQDMPDVLHVRVLAPIELRIQRVEQSAGVTAAAARDLVRRRDQAAADYVKHFYDVDSADPFLYDVVINTRKITPPVATELIIKALDGLPAPA